MVPTRYAVAHKFCCYLNTLTFPCSVGKQYSDRMEGLHLKFMCLKKLGLSLAHRKVTITAGLNFWPSGYISSLILA